MDKIASQQGNFIAIDNLDGALNETYHRVITSVCEPVFMRGLLWYERLIA